MMKINMTCKITACAVCAWAILWSLDGARAQSAKRRVATPPAAGGNASAADGGDGAARGGSTEFDVAADRLVKSAEDLFQAKENDRAVRVLESVIERYPESSVRYKAHLALGRHYVETRREQEALVNLRHLLVLDKPDDPVKGEMLELFLEANYLIGLAHYQTGQYASATPVLRGITRKYPNTVWANQSYYYIGMCHFAEGYWQKAIDALGLVGTFVDPLSPTIQYIEAGRRFYCKIEDADLPILTKLGGDTKVQLETKGGDKETVVCIPMAAGGTMFIGSVGTEVAPAKAGDNVLQVTGGDEVTVTYFDNNTQDGKRNEPRKATVKVVSTGAIKFTLGTYESAADVAFIGQPVFLLLEDADLDVTPKADVYQVKLVSRYRDLEAEATARDSGGDIEQMMSGGAEIRKYRTRDEVTINVTEMGEGASIRSGRFNGRVDVVRAMDGQATSATDAALTAVTGDEIVAEYIDARHIGGEAPRQAAAKIAVAGEIENRPMATQYVLTDPIVAARKNTVEATAFLELARIFKSMGLTKGAIERADLGLAQVDRIIRTTNEIPQALTEEAFRMKWELEIMKEDFNAAIATCRLFSRMFPESPVVDQALLGIGKIHLERHQYAEARRVFDEILRLPQSLAKAEAQFRIAQTVESEAQLAAAANKGAANPSAAIPHYKLCAERYPDSEFAGESLGKMIDYYVDSKDYAQADDLLTQVFQDHPDARFLDAMLLKWVVVTFRMGNFSKALEKCNQLMFEYPESAYAEKAKALLPRIQEKVASGTPKTATSEN
jgi:TolA-binding protein